jgi:hypothetical protein
MVLLAAAALIATKLGADNFYFPVFTLSDMHLKILDDFH